MYAGLQGSPHDSSIILLLLDEQVGYHKLMAIDIISIDSDTDIVI